MMVIYETKTLYQECLGDILPQSDIVAEVLKRAGDGWELDPPMDELKFRIEDVPGASVVEIIVNSENLTIDGMPPHSVHVIVRGGGDVEVARAIYGWVPLYICLVGDICINVEHPHARGRETHQYIAVRFSRPKPGYRSNDDGTLTHESWRT
jgi:hypothetical protein